MFLMRFRAGRHWRFWHAVEWRVARVTLAVRVAWDALRGRHPAYETLCGGNIEHPDIVARYVYRHNADAELARLRAALSDAPHPELTRQLGALRLRVEAQARDLTTMRKAAERRNRDLAALHLVWCDGGCEGGVGGQDTVDRDTVLAAVRNTRRLVTWWNNHVFRNGGRERYDKDRVDWPSRLDT